MVCVAKQNHMVFTIWFFGSDPRLPLSYRVSIIRGLRPGWDVCPIRAAQTVGLNLDGSAWEAETENTRDSLWEGERERSGVADHRSHRLAGR